MYLFLKADATLSICMIILYTYLVSLTLFLCIYFTCICIHMHSTRCHVSPRARGVLFVLKGPYDPRIPPIVKFSQESESARLTKIILSKSTVKTL